MPHPLPDLTPPAPATPGPAAPTGPAARLSLTDFLDLEALQEVQDSFAAVTRLATTIRDADGRPLTLPTDAAQRATADAIVESLIDADDDRGRYEAPIHVEGLAVGSITVEEQALSDLPLDDHRQLLAELAEELMLPEDRAQTLIDAAERTYLANRAAAVQLLYLLANTIARLGYEKHQSQRRVEELSVLYRVSQVLSASRDLQAVLDTAARSVAEMLDVRAVAIRLIDPAKRDELIVASVYNLSSGYLDKGALHLNDSPMLQEAVAGNLVYVEDMRADERVLYPEDADREGLVSMLCAGMNHQGRPIGTVQVYSGERRAFTGFERRLLQAIAQLVGAAIVNRRLDRQREQSQRVIRQLHLAADVQRRMLPSSLPDVAPFQLAARYVPSMELAGDFYDVLDLQGSVGLTVGDVVGKGIAASLLMASVRASLRAYAQDLYDLDEVIARVNNALCQDTQTSEFATLWYGVLDPRNCRLTYCNAGHDPPIVIRDGRVVESLDEGGMIVGVMPDVPYEKGVVQLQPGDTLVVYTDGLLDAFDDEGNKFGRERADAAAAEAAQRQTTAEAILNDILWAQRQFTGRHRSTDDCTVVVARVTGTDGPETAG
ncbi:MAG: SpoIIE family protein phosphatase [Planctomycetota bacterium]